MASILGAVMRYFDIDTGDYITDDDGESNAFLFINHYVARGEPTPMLLVTTEREPWSGTKDPVYT